MTFERCGSFWAVYNDRVVLLHLSKYLSADDVEEMVKRDEQPEAPEPDDVSVQMQLFDTNMVA